jgi:hypothetical protein
VKAEQRKLTKVIKMAKELQTYPNIGWSDYRWDLSEYFDDRAHDKRRYILYFTRQRNKRSDPYIPFEPPYADFVKAIVRIRGSRRAVGWKYQKKMVAAFRYLYEALVRTSTTDPTKLTHAHFHNAIADVCQSAAHYTAYSMGQLLKEIANFVNDYMIARVRINFQNPVSHPKPGDGLDVASQKQGIKKMPSQLELESLAKATNSPVDDDERILLRIIDLHVAGGFRAGEALTIPLDCWVEETALEHNGKVKVDLRTGTSVKRYGIRYWPEKGGEPIVKWLPDCTVPLARRAIEDLTHLCAEARQAATILETSPDRVPLPGNHNHDELLDRFQLKEDLGLKSLGSVRSFLNMIKVRPTESSRGGKRVRYRVGDIENALLHRRGRLVVLRRADGKVQMLSQSLCVMFCNQFSKAKLTLRFLPELVGYKQLTVALGNDAGAPSVFSRRRLTNQDGTRMRIKTHAFRHWLNTLADHGGLSDIELALWMGRRDVRQNAAYKHGTVEQRITWAREMIKAGVLSGVIADTYNRMNDPIEKETFLETFVSVAHFTPYGVCTHDFALDPCRYYLNCLLGCPEYLRTKGNEEERRSIRELRVFTARELEKAEQATERGEWGANNWVDFNRRVLAGADAALAVDADEINFTGDAITVFPLGEYVSND